MDTKVIHDAVGLLLKEDGWKNWLSDDERKAVNIVINAAIDYATSCDRAQTALDMINRKATQWTE